MYVYSDFDEAFVRDRVATFRGQVARRITGELTEDEFKPLRLMNGLYLQLHAYMLRVAIPYGTLNPAQMRQLAWIAERWDKGYGHFTTRQNIQFNWPRLQDVPDMLAALADVGMHAIQTSGNCVRNVTADHFAGAAADEIADPRPFAELLRQWSTDHPEFQFLPRKFKIAITGSPNDRAVTRAHDIGLRVLLNDAGEVGFEVTVGGGLGRTPMLGRVIRDWLPQADLLPYVEAILGVYNQLGRRDNKYKARIKIAVHEMGLETLKELVEARFVETRGSSRAWTRTCWPASRRTSRPPFVRKPIPEAAEGAGFRAWRDTNVTAHREADHAMVTISVKAHGATPGDATSDQMRVMADLAERYGYGELRISHQQNVILPHVHRADLPAVYDGAPRGGARDREPRAHLGHHRLPGDGLLRAGHRAVDPDRAADRAPVRGAEARTRGRAAPAQHLGLHQRLRASPRGPHRHPRARARGRGDLPDHARRRPDRDGRHRRTHRPRLLGRGDRGRGGADRLRLPRPARERGGDLPRRLPPRGPRAVPGGALSQGGRRCGVRPSSSRSRRGWPS
jgi:sulfite reductase (NADPH) hemoprotein beta-component